MGLASGAEGACPPSPDLCCVCRTSAGLPWIVGAACSHSCQNNHDAELQTPRLSQLSERAWNSSSGAQGQINSKDSRVSEQPAFSFNELCKAGHFPQASLCIPRTALSHLSLLLLHLFVICLCLAILQVLTDNCIFLSSSCFQLCIQYPPLEQCGGSCLPACLAPPPWWQRSYRNAGITQKNKIPPFF